MSELLFNAFVTLIVVLDPLGTAPLFVGLTQGRREAYKREAAIKGGPRRFCSSSRLWGRGYWTL
ncbi:MAG: MarC family protein [Actinobacteria bacterium]|nr:MarC family protein [Actinomycetota bacterium]